MACRRRRLEVIGCCTLLACLAVNCRQESFKGDAPFVGKWVLSAGGRPFIALTVEQRNGQYSGSLTTPEHWTTGDGITFTKVGPGTVTRSITSASVNETVLHVLVENPGDRTDKHEFDLALVNPTQASLSLVGAPFMPWPLTKSTNGDLTAQAAFDPALSYTIDRPAAAPSAEMAAIFDEDQAARQNWQNMTDAQRAGIAVQDAVRRKRTRELMDAGKLRAGADFRRAAFVFQHGEVADDFLAAHTAAMVALAMGDTEAGWIAAATLDRYLITVGKPQIYGTQFDTKLAVQEPYNRALISDDLKRALNVPPELKQADQLGAVMGAPKRGASQPGK